MNDVSAETTSPGVSPDIAPAPAQATSSHAAPHAPTPPVAPLIIEPASGWQLINARELWRYRELLYFLTWRDVKVRYKQTLLGAAWAILQPVMMMIVFTIFFGRMAKVPAGDVPYPIFVFTGLLPWTFFATAIASAGNSVVGSERLITKIYFPRLAVPFAAVGAAMVDFAIAFSVLLVLMAWYHIMPTMSILLVPVLIVVLALAALGVGTLLAALNVAYRDFKYVLPFMIQIWMFATPTVYMQLTRETGGASFGWGRWLLIANPLTGLIATFRAAVLGNPMPSRLLVTDVLIVIAIFAIGCLYFRKVEDSFADVI
ncbi:MAG TPA: ABC transporter permease [Tepidisphaeraceae bacterium]|nr:ABC transporter permease [Tepidisphaeraceae bacterium]